MNTRAFNNWIAVFVLILLWIAIFLLAGCTHYSVIKGQEGTPEYTSVQVWSNRTFEQPNIHLDKSAEKVIFDFGASSVNTAPSPFEAIGAMAVHELLQRMMGPIPPTTGEQ